MEQYYGDTIVWMARCFPGDWTWERVYDALNNGTGLDPIIIAYTYDMLTAWCIQRLVEKYGVFDGDQIFRNMGPGRTCYRVKEGMCNALLASGIPAHVKGVFYPCGDETNSLLPL
ncbi:MAG: hypothetical protein UY48_C0006G0048 [Candidatus Gottesmanbacteria bacterium GW2011_GWB1_49_7]|uniref:Uncharacterized protein n=1 Tax=Candidatus Gottesmanbacteria bacterium GW2011_GWB1_49_7 TaxID=1618448 RepID=A0A0G1W323_9BACT|nr:MAG: hypothetical protein UY48_C0006G0048 [Candidatus Gottesmanbacteria bacterium GW2011_GWB1_49_7]